MTPCLLNSLNGSSFLLLVLNLGPSDLGLGCEDGDVSGGEFTGGVYGIGRGDRRVSWSGHDPSSILGIVYELHFFNSFCRFNQRFSSVVLFLSLTPSSVKDSFRHLLPGPHPLPVRGSFVPYTRQDSVSIGIPVPDGPCRSNFLEGIHLLPSEA